MQLPIAILHRILDPLVDRQHVGAHGLGQVQEPGLGVFCERQLLSGWLTSVCPQAKMMEKLVMKARIVNDMFRPFFSNVWFFDTKTLRACHHSMCIEERQKFPVDLSRVHWYSYIIAYCAGMYKYLLKGAVR